ncbi:MAG: type II toxin-antitoxin system VapC family toxin [Luteolibacter sp.]
MPDAIYWDTSALLKLYAPEPDSEHFRDLLREQTDAIAISFLHRIELNFALFAKEQRGEISSGSAKRLFDSFHQHRAEGRFLEIPWGDDVARHAGNALDLSAQSEFPVLLRSIDGIHLGAMLAAGIRKLITTDIRLRNASVHLGLEVIS